MGERSDRYLASFNRIEKALRNQTSHDEYKTFSFLVKESAKKNAAVRRFENDLREFADLRNAIVHQSTNPEFTIAEPHESTVQKIELIEEKVIHPKKVVPTFQKEVATFQSTDSLATILRTMREEDYTQFPVYDGEQFIGLLSESGIANWLSRMVEEEIISFEETVLHQVIDYEEEKHNFEFIDREMSIYDAKEIFKDNLDDGIKIDALLITHSGSMDEKLLGIVTRWDFLRIQ
mgnify:FL=1